MSYVINNATVNGETLQIDATYTINGTELNVSVPVMYAKTKEEIETALSNREISETARINQEAINEQLKSQILA